MEDLINDSLRLLRKILSDTFEDYVLVHIAQSSLIVFSFPAAPEIPTCYGYIIDRTPLFLEQQRVLEILSVGRYVIRDFRSLANSGPLVRLDDPYHVRAAEGMYRKFTSNKISFETHSFYTPQIKNINLNVSRGLYYIVVDRKKAEEWIKAKSVKHEALAPQERDYWYEDKQIKFRLKSGGIDQFDFSKADVSRKLFETFWSLWNSDGIGQYTREKVCQKYKELFKEDLSAGRIGENVSNLRASIINPKITIKDRIEWKYDRKNSAWIFRIIPLDRSS